MKAGALRQHKKWFGPAIWLSCWSQVVASCPQYFAHKCDSVTQVARSASPFSGGHWHYTMPIYGPYMAHIWPIWRMMLRLGGFMASPTGPTVGVALWCALHTSCGREETLRSGCRTWCVEIKACQPWRFCQPKSSQLFSIFWHPDFSVEDSHFCQLFHSAS